MEAAFAKHDDLEAVGGLLRELAEDGRTEDLIGLVLGLLAQLREKNTALEVRLQNALRQLYGRRSEKISPDQLALLFEALEQGEPHERDETQKPGTVEQPKEAPKPPPRARRGGRKAIPDHLPRETKEVRVPNEERACPACSTERTCIGHIESEILELVPAHFKVIVERREKLACRSCEGEVMAAPSEKVMDKGRPGPRLLSKIVVDKHQDAMPLYRQSQAYARLGVSLSPSTLGDWCSFAVDVLRPIAVRIRQRVVREDYVQGDDTGIRVLDRDDPRGVKRGHLWVYVGGGLVAFHYTPDWKAEGPMAFLRNFEGVLQTDGYAGFDKALRPPDAEASEEAAARRLGCGMHIRRYFEKACKAGDVRAAVAMQSFQALYRVERSCKEEELSPEQRHARRAEQSIPVFEELYQWIHQNHEAVVPGTPIAKATGYAIGQEAAFRRCFSDGRYEIDNGEVERQIRRVALGRKNYLFAGSDKGAERLADAYTVLGSGHMHGVNLLDYVADVIEKLQAGWPNARLDELLPDAWTPGLTL